MISKYYGIKYILMKIMVFLVVKEQEQVSVNVFGICRTPG